MRGSHSVLPGPAAAASPGARETCTFSGPLRPPESAALEKWPSSLGFHKACWVILIIPKAGHHESTPIPSFVFCLFVWRGTPIRMKEVIPYLP